MFAAMVGYAIKPDGVIEPIDYSKLAALLAGSEKAFVKKIAIDVSEERTKQKYPYAGMMIFVENPTAPDVPVYIRFNRPDGEEFTLTNFRKMRGPFGSFYITNAAGTGTLNIIVTRGYQFEFVEATSITETEINLDDLADVVITSVADDEILGYSSGWINRTLAEAGIAAVAHAIPGSHTFSGLTVGHVLRASGATTAVFAAIQAGDLPTGIDAIKIADGSVSNTEFQYLNGVTSALQTQLDTKLEDITGENLGDLSDVYVPTPTDAYVLTWVDANSRWEAVAAAGGISTLDEAYDGGASITVDDAGGNLVFNLAEAADFIVQDNGTAFFTLDDTGGLTHTAPAQLATSLQLTQAANYTTAADLTLIDIDRTAVIPARASSITFTGFDIDPLSITAPLNGSGNNTLNAMYFRPTLDNDFSGGGTYNQYISYVFGMDFLAHNTGDNAQTQHFLAGRYARGILAEGKITVDITGGTSGNRVFAYGVEAKGTLVLTETSGSVDSAGNAQIFGVKATALGDTSAAGSSTEAFGVYGIASGADINYAGYFTKNVDADGAAVVHILQDHLTAACPCLTLDQDDESEGFIDFVGSDRGAATKAQSFWVFPDYAVGAGIGMYGDYQRYLIDAVGEYVHFSFKVPADFSSLTSVKIVYIPGSTEAATIDWTATTDFGADGEDYNNHSDSATADGLDCYTDRLKIKLVDISAAFTDLAAGDYVGLKFNCDAMSGTALFYLIGLEFNYNGTVTAASVRAELSGTVKRIGLFADA